MAANTSFIRRLTLSDFSPPKPQRVELPPVPANKPFRFLDLPSELRIRVYEYHFEGVTTETDPAIDLNPDNGRRMSKKLGLLRTCRTVYNEASHFFYSHHTFRIYPTHPSRFFKTKRPLLARLKPHQRACITKLELRLGPGWGKPPPGWVVSKKLALNECINARKMNVIVQIDPSANWLEGFRKADGFYEQFSRNLLQTTLAAMPWLERVELDAWPGVKRDCPIMRDLVEVSLEEGRSFAWAQSLAEREEQEAALPTPTPLVLSNPLPLLSLAPLAVA